MNKDQKQADNLFNDYLEDVILQKRKTDGSQAVLPEPGSDLKHLLQMVETARSVVKIAPRADFRAKARYQFRSAVYDALEKKKHESWHWSWRAATIIPIATTALMIAGSTTAAASSSCMPGDPLYQVKLAVEQIQITLTPSDSARARLYAMTADRRVNEIISLAQRGNMSMIDSTAQRLENDLAHVTGLVTSNDQKLLATSNTTVSVLSPGAPDLQTYEVTTATTKAETAGTGTRVTDPALIKLLLAYADKYPAELTALLGSIPEASMEEILHMIELTTSYKETLEKISGN